MKKLTKFFNIYIVFMLVLFIVIYISSTQAKYTSNSTITDNINLSIGTYKLTLNPSGGTIDGKNSYEKAVSAGDNYGELPTPKRSGYTFAGWYTKPGDRDFYGEKVTSASTMANSDVTIYAHWVYTWTVIYDSNGGTGTMESTLHGWYTGVHVSENTFVKPGYVFGGWYLSREENGKTTWSYGDSKASWISPNDWYEEGQQPSGHIKYILPDMNVLQGCTYRTDDVLTAHAVWIPVDYYFYNDGIESKFYLDSNHTIEVESALTMEEIINSATKNISIQLDSTYSINSDETWISNTYNILIKKNTGDRLIDILGGSLTIGGSSSKKVTIDCNYTQSTVLTSIRVAENSILNINKNAIIQNGYVTDTRGGAIYVYGGTINMYDGVIRKNKSDNSGGAILVENNGTFNMYGGSITENFSKAYGGGIMVEDGILHRVAGSIDNNTALLGNDNIAIGKNGKLS